MGGIVVTILLAIYLPIFNQFPAALELPGTTDKARRWVPRWEQRKQQN